MKNQHQSRFAAAPATGGAYAVRTGRGVWTHSAVVAGTGAVSATVIVEATQDPEGLIGWYTLCTLNPSGTTEAEAGYTGLNAPEHIRHRITAISGTSAVLRTFSTGL